MDRQSRLMAGRAPAGRRFCCALAGGWGRYGRAQRALLWDALAKGRGRQLITAPSSWPAW